MNKERILKLADVIEASKTFDMRRYWDWTNLDWQNPVFYSKLYCRSCSC